MIKYLKLIRLPNLLMVALTMYLMRYGIIQPLLEYGYSPNIGEPIKLGLPHSIFLILVIINILLGAAGYIINDYFDRKIDTINRPEKVIIGNTVHRRFAIILHSTLNGIAVLLATFLSWYFKKPLIVVAYIMLGGIYWLYSTTYKKQFLIGNIIVAAVTASIPLQVIYFELIALNLNYSQLLVSHSISFKVLFLWVAAFGVFAFLTNLLREIIKDVEDFEGDYSYGCNTIPVMAGIKTSKIVTIVLIFSILWLLSFLYFKFLNDPISKWYLAITVGSPLVLAAILIARAKTVKNYQTISWIIKLIMFTGLMYAMVARYIMENNFNL